MDAPISNLKAHIGNIKLSKSRRAASLQIFKGSQFYVIPLDELSTKVGRIFQYIDGHPEIIGQISLHDNTFYRCRIKSSFIYIKKTYIDLLLNDTDLVLGIFEA